MSPPKAFNKAKALEEGARLVSQKKISQAIKLYLAIAENDPTDLNLLNTIGDLCIRDGNNAEALKQFQKLADAYTHEGFLLKAVAIQKKISKLIPNDVESILKLAEHCSTLGLRREGREHYLQALALCEKQGLSHKALEILRKMAMQEPENLNYRVRLAECCVALNQNGPAAQLYAEIAEIAYKRGETAAVGQPLERALQLHPGNAQANLLNARLALDAHEGSRAREILQSCPALKSNPEAAKLLIDSYLLEGGVTAASQAVKEAFHQGNDCSAALLLHYVRACLNASGPDAAFEPIREIAGQAFERNMVEAIREPLRLISEKQPDHLPTLELLLQVGERAAAGEELLKAAEALSHAYLRTNQKNRAEELYRQLISRHPGNYLWQARLDALLQTGVNLQEPGTATTEPGAAGLEEDEEDPRIEEALENASVFARYGLIDKALEEIDGVLESAPNNVNLLKRAYEIAKQDRPLRAVQIAETLAGLLRERGDQEAAAQFAVFARELQAPDESPGSGALGLGADSSHFQLPAGSGRGESTPADQPHPDWTSTPDVSQGPEQNTETSIAAPVTAISQIDLTGEVEALASVNSGKMIEEATATPNAFAEEQAEIEFYLEYGFFAEAQQAVALLAQRFPGHPGLPALEMRVEEAAQAAPVIQEEPAPPTEMKPALVDTAPGQETEPAAPPVLPQAMDVESTPGELPKQVESSASRPEVAEAQVASFPDLQALLMDLTGEAAVEEAGSGPAMISLLRQETPAKPNRQVPQRPAASINQILQDLSSDLAVAESPDSPEKHYNLGLAFREMELIDEAIGEFQKVVRRSVKGNLPPRFLEACSLLASCFMQKGMASIAVKWYQRALDVPGVEGDARLALNYNLADALDLAGQKQLALERFMEVYSENIDYRDVADRLRVIQQNLV
jgi:lipopolysaccharide biosynthesis regulator YciM